MAMSPQEKFEYWLDVAQDDLRVAGTLLANKHWLYVAFMCQQAVEKLAKGMYTLYLDDDTPRIHNIRAIFERFEKKLPVGIPDDWFDFFDSLSTYYLNNRYPDFKAKLGPTIGKAEADATFSRAKEVFAWLLTLKP